jgi:hypothetical protein
MTDYVKSTSFASKDALASGNPLKIVKGTEIDIEFNNIAAAIATKANSIDTALTGVPTAPTAAPGTNTSQIATTAFVAASAASVSTAFATKANIASPAFTGVPTAPTASAGTNTTQLATTAFVTTALQAVYPVGSIYINAGVTTNPATLLGFGTWTAFGAGRVMVGLNGGDALYGSALEETGGSKDAAVVSHSHGFSGSLSGTTNEAGVHNHSAGISSAASGEGNPATQTSGPGSITTANAGAHTHSFSASYSGTTASSGSSGTNANLQPYITVVMWKRTA